MLYCTIATSGPTPFSPCRPAPMRLYMARLALMIRAFIVSLLVLLLFREMPRWVLQVDMGMGSLLRRQDGSFLEFRLTILVLSSFCPHIFGVVSPVQQ